MKHISESDRIIAEYLESGDYYKDARAWYCNKYLSISFQRSIILVITSIITFVFLGMCYTYSLNVVSKKYPFPIYAYDQTEYFPHIKPLSNEKEPISDSISKYLLIKYVEFRENYKFSDYVGQNKDIQIRKVQSLSSRKVMKQYVDQIDPESNPNSPMVIYKNNAIRKVKVSKIELVGSNQAEIYYTAALYDSREGGVTDNVENTSQWKAVIIFRLSDISNVLEKKQDLSFVVTDYKTIKL